MRKYSIKNIFTIRFLAVACNQDIRIYESPSFLKSIEPFIIYKKLKGVHSQKIITLLWSPDSRFIISTSKDLTVKINSLHKINEFQPFTFTGHKQPCVQAFFSDNMEYVFHNYIYV